MMAPPYQRPLPYQQGYPAGSTRAAAPAPVQTDRADSSSQSVSNDRGTAAENVTVRINGMRFEPSNITVKPGTTVTWVHGSSVPHTVTGNADGLRSSTLYSGQQFTHTFDAAGRYDYSCDFHPAMKGSVIVEESDT
jgi:plastocyanin